MNGPTFQPRRAEAGRPVPLQPTGPPPRPPPEPQLLVLKLLYLFRVPARGLFDQAAAYICSAHVGVEARGDVPAQPGRFSSALIEPHPPQAVNPEEQAMRQRMVDAIATMAAEHSQHQAKPGAEGQPLPHPPPADSGLECRFNHRLAVRLSEVGPGPAAGGPSYFRVDVWRERAAGLLGRDKRMELFGRVFVPLTDPKCQRRPCAWPVVDPEGRDIAYLICDFAFVHTPQLVRGLQVEGATSSEIALTWSSPQGDSLAPVLGYTVEACALSRGQEGPSRGAAALAWQSIGDLPAARQPGTVAKNLRGNTRYCFRVRAVNEAGIGEPVEADGATSPVAPSACGRPRLAGCAGPVLTIEWDPPTDTGGVPVVAYRLWVRPYTASRADPSEWREAGHAKHQEGLAQRAEIRTEELNPSVARYLCRVAAVNAAGEVGPSTPDGIALPFPNPCAICGPSSQAAPCALGNWLPLPGPGMMAQDYGAGSLTLFEPGSNRQRRVPIHAESGFDEPISIIEAYGGMDVLSKRYGSSPSHAAVVAAAHDWAAVLPPPPRQAAAAARLRQLVQQNDPLALRYPATEVDDPLQGLDSQDFLGPFASEAPPSPPLPRNFPGASPSRWSGQVAQVGEWVCQDPLSATSGFSDLPDAPPVEGREFEREDVARRLQDKEHELQTKLDRFHLVASHLHAHPQDMRLRQSHEGAEIEAAGCRAEVAVLKQGLDELDAAAVRMRSQSGTLTLDLLELSRACAAGPESYIDTGRHQYS